MLPDALMVDMGSGTGYGAVRAGYGLVTEHAVLPDQYFLVFPPR